MSSELPVISDLEPARELCWIASYPRSGNTFLRIVLSQVVFGAERARFLDGDLPEYVHPKPLDLASSRPVATDSGSVAFVKSHYCKPVQVAGVRNVFGVYIYRNPLDVFLSGLNYVYINAEKYDSFRKYFLNERPKDVDTIVADGELDHYFNRFVRDDGIAVFRPFSGGWAEGVTNWCAAEASSNGAITCLSYDDVVKNTERIVGDLMRRIGVVVDDDAIAAGVARARQHKGRRKILLERPRWRASRIPEP